jgi:hypothetical protein
VDLRDFCIYRRQKQAAGNLIPESNYPKIGYYSQRELTPVEHNTARGGGHMSWNDKYWDIISNLYWTPRYLGLKSIARSHWRVDGDRISIPSELIANTSGPLYTRGRSFCETQGYLNGQEEILNHFFNLAFSIVGDEVISRLLCQPLEILDRGPFESVGREIGLRYGWRKSENVTQQDGFFVGPSSLIGVELKLGSASWAEQIAKYAALMVWEEALSGSRKSLGLLFIVPEQAILTHWSHVGLNGPAINKEFVKKLDLSKLPKKIQTLFATNPAHLDSVFDRLRLSVLSWDQFRTNSLAIEHELDSRQPGDQTLHRLLVGLRDQIEHHDHTDIKRPQDHG